MYICVYTCVYVFVRMRICVYIYLNMCVYLYAHVYSTGINAYFNVHVARGISVGVDRGE